MAARVISIEIGDSLTRVCETDYRAKTHKVYRYFTIPTLEGTINDGVLTASPEYIRTLKSALSSNRMRAGRVVFSITSGKVINREIMIPCVKENRIADVVNALAPDYFPIDLSGYQLAYSVLEKIDEPKDIQQYKILVWAAPSVLLDGYYDLARALKLEPVAIDYAGNSVFQVVRSKRDEGTSMVIKLEEHSTIVMAVRSSKLVFIRNIAHGVEEESELLIGGISRVADYYAANNAGMPIRKVYITGLGAVIRDLPEALARELNCPVEILRQAAGWNLEKNFKTQDYGEYIACVGAAACPLGFRQSEKSGKKEKRYESRETGASLAYTVLVMGLLFSAVLAAVSVSRYMKLQRQNMELKRKYSELSPILSIYDEYAAVYASYTLAGSMYAATENRNEELVGFLEEMERKMPADVQVVSLTSTAEGVIINMNVGTKGEAASAIEQLRSFESLYAESVSVTSVVEEMDEESGSASVNFAVTAAYRDIERIEDKP